MPTISVIVPVYKVEPYIRKCVDSILGQTFSDIQVILVDDGSPDQCGKICDEYAKQDNRVEVIHKENGGLSDARNAGIPYAKGEYIIFLDSDDYIENDMFEYMYTRIKDSGADMATCAYMKCIKTESRHKRKRWILSAQEKRLFAVSSGGIRSVEKYGIN